MRQATWLQFPLGAQTLWAILRGTEPVSALTHALLYNFFPLDIVSGDLSLAGFLPFSVEVEVLGDTVPRQ